jgi:hypothetical protein
MIIDVNGKTHRLFFQHEEVPRRLRYAGRVGKTEMTTRTVCRIEEKIGQQPDGKGVWRAVAEGSVYRFHKDLPKKSDGVRKSFSAMMAQLTARKMFTAAERGYIAGQFLASRPRTNSTKELKAVIRAQQAEIDNLKRRIKSLED